MDGVGGFEPPNDWTKTNCLAAWLYPNLSKHEKLLYTNNYKMSIRFIRNFIK